MEWPCVQQLVWSDAARLGGATTARVSCDVLLRAPHQPLPSRVCARSQDAPLPSRHDGIRRTRIRQWNERGVFVDCGGDAALHTGHVLLCGRQWWCRQYCYCCRRAVPVLLQRHHAALFVVEQRWAFADVQPGTSGWAVCDVRYVCGCGERVWVRRAALCLSRRSVMRLLMYHHDGLPMHAFCRARPVGGPQIIYIRSFIAHRGVCVCVCVRACVCVCPQLLFWLN